MRTGIIISISSRAELGTKLLLLSLSKSIVNITIRSLVVKELESNYTFLYSFVASRGVRIRTAATRLVLYRLSLEMLLPSIALLLTM